MLICVINESSMLSNSDAEIMCKAVQIQLTNHVFPAWNMKDGSIQFCPDKTKIPHGAWIISILDNPTVAGALGYHSENGDIIDGFVFCQPVLSNGGVALYDANNPQNVSIASVFSHEIIESIADPFANFWADGKPLPQGSSYALELCDPVEGNSYEIDVDGVKVSVSNFVYPSWFNAQANASDMPFDQLHLLSAPFTMTSGGYMIVRQSGQAQQVFGESMPGWKQDIKKGALARNQRLRK